MVLHKLLIIQLDEIYSYRKWVLHVFSILSSMPKCCYRLTGDIKWPVSTPFDVAIGNLAFKSDLQTLTYSAIGPLAGDFPILSLRTNKADVAVGVPQEVADKLDKAGEKWRVNGK